MHQLQRTDPEFPAATCLSIGKVWDAPMMRAYGRDRLTGNNRHRAFLQHYYTHANLTAACRHAGITKNTGYRWLEKLGGVRASAR